MAIFKAYMYLFKVKFLNLQSPTLILAMVWVAG